MVGMALHNKNEVFPLDGQYVIAALPEHRSVSPKTADLKNIDD
jgi:hypothetical protein